MVTERTMSGTHSGPDPPRLLETPPPSRYHSTHGAVAKW